MTNAEMGAMPDGEALKFLSALYPDDLGGIVFDVNGSSVPSGDNVGSFLADHPEARILPTVPEGVRFVYAMVATADATYCDETEPKPSAALYNGKTMMAFWTLLEPVHADDATLVQVLQRFNMTLETPVPLPNAEWKFINTGGAKCSIEDLHQAFCLEETPEEPAEPEPEYQTYGDAKIITSYNEADYNGRQIIVSIGPNQFAKNWKPQQLPLAGLIHQFTKHQIGKKDGLAVVFGDMVAGQRVKKAIKTCTAIGLDIDTGVPSKFLDTELAKLGCLAIRTTTHSHGKRSSEIDKDQILKFFPDATEITTPMIQTYLRDKKRWDDSIVETVHFIEEDHTDKGIVCRISHMEMPKHRVIVPLLYPYIIADEGRTQIEAMAKWAKVPAALADKLGVPFDRSCVDPSRLFYLPRHDKNRPFEISLFGGPLFDLASLELTNAYDAIAAAFAKSGGSKSVTLEGKALGSWWVKYAHGFQIMEVIEQYAPDRKRSKASHGYNICCPFDADHSNAGDSSDQACFAVNAAEGGNEYFIIKCQHAGCLDKTANDMLGQMIKDEWFEESVLKDPNFNVAEIEEESSSESASAAESGPQSAEQLIDSLPKPLASADVKKIIKKLAKETDQTALVTCKGKLKAKWSGSTIGQIEGLLSEERGSKRKAETQTCFDAAGRHVFQYSNGLDVVEVSEAITSQMLRWNEADPDHGRATRKPWFTSLLDEITVLKEHPDGPVFVQPTERKFWLSLPEIFLVQKINDEGAPRERQNVKQDIGGTVFHTTAKKLSPTPEMVRAPFLAPNGELISKPRWYGPEMGSRDGIYLDLGSLELPPLPESPSDDDVIEALRWIHELLEEFHFSDVKPDGSISWKASYANAIAMCLTLFVRRYLKSCTPLFSIEKPHESAGATLLGEIPFRIFQGRPGAPTPYPKSEEEMDKVIVAKLKQGDLDFRFDNVTDLNSKPLKSALTSPELQGRVLGTSIMFKCANNFLFVATGINPSLDKEMARRVCVMRLDLQTETPGDKKYEKELKEWIPENRSHLVWALLTLINHWRAKEMPLFTERKLSSFEHWSKVVGGILECAGVEGFLDNPKSANVGSEDAELRECARLLFEKYTHQECESTEMAQWAIGTDLFPLIHGYDEAEKRRSFKKMLIRLRNKTYTLMQQPDPRNPDPDFDGRVQLMILDIAGVTKYQWKRVKP